MLIVIQKMQRLQKASHHLNTVESTKIAMQAIYAKLLSIETGFNLRDSEGYVACKFVSSSFRKSLLSETVFKGVQIMCQLSLTTRMGCY